MAKVYVTGIGAITAAGMSAKATWENVLAGNISLGEIQNYDISSWSHKLGGEIHEPQLAKLLPDKKLLKLISRQDVFGINAAMQAITDSEILDYRGGLTDPTNYNETTGIYVGSPGNKFYQQYDFLPLLAGSRPSPPTPLPQAGEGSLGGGSFNSSLPQAGEGGFSSPLPQAGEGGFSSPLPQAGEGGVSSPLPLAGEGSGVRVNLPGVNLHHFADHLFETVHPMWLLRILPNNVLAYVGIHYGFKGANQNITNHAASGAQAVLEAYHAIQTGQINRAVVVAYDVGIEPQALFYYQRLGVLSPDHLRPFDITHNGTILSEGAAAIILESESSVNERNAKPYLELIGGKTKTEATGLFSIEEDGEALTLLLSETLADSGLTSDDLAYVVAHGNGNPKSDISEALALKRILKTNQVPVTAFKWAMGHTLCASGILDIVMMACANKTSQIPGIKGLDTAAELCSGLNFIKETTGFKSEEKYALLINRGFAAMNACILVK